ncbi:MAG: nucleotidyl transferase AbiEii/AbiGii toxin family protein [Chitinophagaceae bacterium]|nr:nucleotidyl transferase AbiEii/AbiGii toxin family protein [Chitinophagaceae bacterium]
MIDIITNHTEKEITAVLDKIVGHGLFTRVGKPDNERKTAMEAPVTHYKLYYESKIDTNYGEEPILLDVLHMPNPYPKVIDYPIEHEWLESEGETVFVKIPVYDCILGDKLTAFAPKTTGILYSKQKPVEIIKQLYDLSFLFDQIESLPLLKESYLDVVAEELRFRGLSLSYQEVLDDTIEACVVIANRKPNDEEFKQLHRGIINITNFIIDRFKIEEVFVAAGKIAYLCLILKSDVEIVVEKFKTPDQVKELLITNPDFNWLNKLKKSNPEAFFYWEKAMALKT